MHGPVGSSKSTIARLLKKGLEEYSRTDDGMLFSCTWKGENGVWHNAHSTITTEGWSQSSW